MKWEITEVEEEVNQLTFLKDQSPVMIKNIFLFLLFLSITSYGQVKLEGIVKEA